MRTLSAACGLLLYPLLASTLHAQVPGDAVIVDEGAIGKTWTLAPGVPLVPPVFTAGVARGGAACVALRYTVGVDGAPGDFAVVKQWNVKGDKAAYADYWQDFASAAAGAVSRWRFAPLPGIPPVPTTTVATIAYPGGEGQSLADVRNHCRIAGLRDHLASLKRRNVEDGIGKRDQERQRDADQEAMMRSIRARR